MLNYWFDFISKTYLHYLKLNNDVQFVRVQDNAKSIVIPKKLGVNWHKQNTFYETKTIDLIHYVFHGVDFYAAYDKEDNIVYYRF